MLCFTVSMLLLVHCNTQPAKDRGSLPLELGRLQGKWVATSVEETNDRGKPELETLLVIDKDSARLIKGKDEVQFRIRVNPKTDPPSIDIVYDGGRSVNHAIYRLRGETLTICVSNRFRGNMEKDRPIAFTTDRKSNKNLKGLLVFEFQRSPSE